ncbi:hypothetical protein GYMLUDRAFT_54913 [Collybiopsis luxurians FD-317 M1]|nr:hypothetical protein GYMLUDRAFT_54913 [Collybiopsis luxurians FD-317 M1]
MLARPRPPAQLRRASKGSPEVQFPSTDDPDLPQLLSRADGLIRERERELSFTSERSRELKQIHEALVAQTPLTSPSRFHSSLPLSPHGTPFQTLHALHSSQSSDYSNNSHPSAHTRHTRRISITQSELARLSDQNAELLQKLEQLEEESVLADKSGKRRLGKLEREIQTLRDELDEARQEAARKDQEEKKNLKEIRRKTNEESESKSSPTFQDFAPSSSLSHSNSSDSTYTEDNTTSLHSETSNKILIHLLAKISELEEANVQISRDQRETAGRLRDAQNEVEGMRRVWSYLGIGPGPGNDQDIDVEIIDDDQDLNGDEDKRGTIRFRSLRNDVLASLTSASHAASNSVSSTSPQIDSINSLASVDLDFDNDIRGDMHSTLRTPQKASQSFGRRGKGRRSVVGLFNQGENLNNISSDSLNLDAAPTSPTSSRVRAFYTVFSPSDELSELDISLSLQHSHSLDVGEISPQSDLGSPNGRRPRTLGSEIGDFDDFSLQRSRNNSLVQELEDSLNSAAVACTVEHKECPDNDDGLTEKSQYISSKSAGIRITPLTPDKGTLLFSGSQPSTTTSFTAVLPPTSDIPFSSSVDSSSRGSAMRTNTNSIHARRTSLSQSVKARAGRWGPRLSNVFTSGHNSEATAFGTHEGLGVKLGEGWSHIFSSSASIPETKIIDSKVVRLRRNSGATSLCKRVSSQPFQDIARSQTNPESAQPSAEAPESEPSRKPSTSHALIRPPSSNVERVRSWVLEAWLWFQLIVILGVFIFTVAKKGPRGVLRIDGEAEDEQDEQDKEKTTDSGITLKPVQR